MRELGDDVTDRQTHRRTQPFIVKDFVTHHVPVEVSQVEDHGEELPCSLQRTLLSPAQQKHSHMNNDL